MYVAPGIGAVPALMRVASPAAVRTLPRASLARPLPVTGWAVGRSLTVTRAPAPSPVLTPAGRFAATPTPVSAPAPTVIKPAPTVTALRPSAPGRLIQTAIERIARRPVPGPVAAARPSSPFSLVTQAVRAARNAPTATPLPRALLDRIKGRARVPIVPRPDSIVGRVLRQARVAGKPIAPDTMFGRLIARAKASLPPPSRALPAVMPPGAVGPAAVPPGMAPIVPAIAPGPGSPFLTLEDVLPPQEAAAGPEPLYDEAPEPMFGDITESDLSLQETTQSEIPQWLEGAEDLAVLEADAEEVPDELLQLATLNSGTQIGATPTIVYGPPAPRAPVDWRPILILAGLALIAHRRGGRGPGRRGW